MDLCRSWDRHTMVGHPLTQEGWHGILSRKAYGFTERPNDGSLSYYGDGFPEFCRCPWPHERWSLKGTGIENIMYMIREKYHITCTKIFLLWNRKRSFELARWPWLWICVFKISCLYCTQVLSELCRVGCPQENRTNSFITEAPGLRRKKITEKSILGSI